jgi:hypothetical protein
MKFAVATYQSGPSRPTNFQATRRFAQPHRSLVLHVRWIIGLVGVPRRLVLALSSPMRFLLAILSFQSMAGKGARARQLGAPWPLKYRIASLTSCSTISNLALLMPVRIAIHSATFQLGGGVEYDLGVMMLTACTILAIVVSSFAQWSCYRGVTFLDGDYSMVKSKKSQI